MGYNGSTLCFQFPEQNTGEATLPLPCHPLSGCQVALPAAGWGLNLLLFRGTTSHKSSTLNHTTGHGIIPCFLQWSALNKKGNRKTAQTFCNPASAHSLTVSVNPQVRDFSKSSRALLAVHTGNQCTGQCTLLTCFTFVDLGCNVTPRQLKDSAPIASILALKPPQQLSGLCCAAAPSLSRDPATTPLVLARSRHAAGHCRTSSITWSKNCL